MAMHFKSDYRRALPSIALLPLLFADIASAWLGWAVPAFFLILSLLFNLPARTLKRASASYAGVQAASSAHITLYACLAHSRPGFSRLAKRIKLAARAARHYHVTRSWLHYWNATPMRVQLATATPRLLQKIYRPYQSLRLQHRQERLDLLVNHYDFIFRHDLGALILGAATAPASLGSFTGKSGAVYEVQLASIAALDREGELTLMLSCDRQHLFSVAFTFCDDDLMPCIGIGCLQGPRGNESQEQVRRATRDMFGLRPKSLMLRLVREIGHAYGCKKLILVGNKNRVLLQQVRTGKVLADYDDFWQETGANLRPDGDYELCCDDIPVPDLANIPSHKRAEARRRIELTEHAIQATLTGFSGNRI